MRKILCILVIIMMMICGCNSVDSNSVLDDNLLANTKWECLIDGKTYQYQFNNDASEFISMGHGTPLYKKHKNQYRIVAFSNEELIFDIETEVIIEVNDKIMIITEKNDNKEKKQEYKKID